MNVENLMIDMGADVYYTPEFRDVLEDHMDYLRKHPATSTFLIKPELAYQWRGDLFGLLLKLNKPTYLHWVIMRMNNYTSPLQFKQDTLILMEPSAAVVDKIRQTAMSTPRIS